MHILKRAREGMVEAAINSISNDEELKSSWRKIVIFLSHLKALGIEFLSPISLPFLCILSCLPFFGKLLHNFTLGEISLVCVGVDGISREPSGFSSGTQKCNVPAIHIANAIFDSYDVTVI